MNMEKKQGSLSFDFQAQNSQKNILAIWNTEVYAKQLGG